MSTPKRNRSEEYQHRKQKCLQFNICFKCSKSKGINKWLCDGCLEKTRKADNKRAAKNKINNLCSCGQPTLPNRKLCEICAKNGRLTQTNRRTKHKQKGDCVTCGKPPMPGLSACADCAARATRATLHRYNSNKQNNICPFCGGELGDKFRCENCHKNHLKHGKIRWHQQRSIVLEHYGGICMCCGETAYEFLEVDHINGGGTKHRKEIGSHLIEWIIKQNFPSDLQILCANCNRGCGKFKVCPHKLEPLLPKSQHAQNERKRRIKCITHYGGKCQCCGETNWAFLEFDHINNDGNEHRKNFKGSIVRWLIANDFPSDIQLLCSNCNKTKGLYKYCPHTERAGATAPAL